MIEMDLAVGVTSRYVTIVVDDVLSVPLRSGSSHDVINICLVIELHFQLQFLITKACLYV